MFLCVPCSAGEFPVEIKVPGEQLVQITNTGNKPCSLEKTAYMGLFWFKRDETWETAQKNTSLRYVQALPGTRELRKYFLRENSGSTHGQNGCY